MTTVVSFAVIVALLLTLVVAGYADSAPTASIAVAPTIVCKARCDTPEPPAITTATPTAGYRVYMVEVRR